MRRRLDKTSSPFKWNVLMEKRVLCMTIRHDDDKCKYVRDWAVADRRDRWITENDDRDDASAKHASAHSLPCREKLATMSSSRPGPGCLAGVGPSTSPSTIR